MGAATIAISLISGICSGLIRPARLVSLAGGIVHVHLPLVAPCHARFVLLPDMAFLPTMAFLPAMPNILWQEF